MVDATVPWCWGATEDDRTAGYPCDGLVPAPVVSLCRAIGVAAPAPAVFRWVCQLRAAPYSYDLLDNAGRRSPRELTPGLDELAVGQTLMTVFEIVDVEPGRQITVRALPAAAALFGPMALTYRVRSTGERASRLVVRIEFGVRGPLGRARAYLLAWGDLVMMRKQLLTLRELAQGSTRR